MMQRPDDPDTVTSHSRADRHTVLAEVKIGDSLADRFLLKEILGHGSTGTVFAALAIIEFRHHPRGTGRV